MTISRMSTINQELLNELQLRYSSRIRLRVEKTKDQPSRDAYEITCIRDDAANAIFDYRATYDDENQIEACLKILFNQAREQLHHDQRAITSMMAAVAVRSLPVLSEKDVMLDDLRSRYTSTIRTKMMNRYVADSSIICNVALDEERRRNYCTTRHEEQLIRDCLQIILNELREEQRREQLAAQRFENSAANTVAAGIVIGSALARLLSK